jgi:hypothetical protein
MDYISGVIMRKRRIRMTRCVSIYALNDMEYINKAKTLLSEIKKFLPEGVFVEVYAKGDGNIPESLPRWVFGDLVQIIEFPAAYQATEFQESKAFKEQQKMTGGLFSNVTTTSYQI